MAILAIMTMSLALTNGIATPDLHPIMTIAPVDAVDASGGGQSRAQQMMARVERRAAERRADAEAAEYDRLEAERQAAQERAEAEAERVRLEEEARLAEEARLRAQAAVAQPQAQPVQSTTPLTPPQ